MSEEDREKSQSIVSKEISTVRAGRIAQQCPSQFWAESLIQRHFLIELEASLHGSGELHS